MSDRYSFYCDEKDISTRNFAFALKWFLRGFTVRMFDNGVFVNNLVYAGEIEDFDEIYNFHTRGLILKVLRHNKYTIVF